MYCTVNSYYSVNGRVEVVIINCNYWNCFQSVIITGTVYYASQCYISNILLYELRLFIDLPTWKRGQCKVNCPVYTIEKKDRYQGRYIKIDIKPDIVMDDKLSR